MGKRKTTTRIVKAAGVSKNIEAEATRAAEEEEEPGMDVEEDAEEEEEDQESPEEKLARIEEETVAARKKELKSMAVGDLKSLLASNGLEADKMKKDDMMKAMLTHEAKARKSARAHEAKIRGVIVSKKNELEDLSISDLSKMCTAMGIQGAKKKEDRVRLILEDWQKNDGVEKALAQMARDERLKELQAMEIGDLRMLCEANGIDPCIKEVMADRVAKAEKTAGKFARPSLEKKEEVLEQSKGGDLVDTLLANESSRKASQKKQAEQGEAIKAKIAELKAKPVEELKKLLRKSGAEVEGKKEALVEALISISKQEEELNSRKAELKAMSISDLKALVSERSLECGNSKDKMIVAVLEHEAKSREDAKAFDKKAEEVILQKKGQLEGKTATELKDLCSSTNLAVGGGKEDKIARLLEQARADGEVDHAVSALIFCQRKEELRAMEKQELLTLCGKVGTDPCVKEVMIERLMSFEDENGVVEPPAKKSRKAQKS